MEGYGLWLDPLRVEIAIARGATAEVERLLGELGLRGLDDPDGLIARLNALVALGRRAEIEEEAPAAAKPETYLEPFALRALGFARQDQGLIGKAIRRFEAMGMAWHAAETRKLLRA
jgi:hypothetical protein